MTADEIANALSTSWLGRALVLLSSTTSTNDEAARRAREGAPHGLCVLAETQTRGRGQKQHAWWSPAGENLYLSAVIRLPMPPRAAPPLTLAAGVAVADAVASFVPGRASLKWPNDLLVDGRKIAGVLTEMSTRGDRIEAVIVGIGLNVNVAAFPDELATIATSLRLATGQPQDRVRVLAALLGSLEEWIDRFVADGAGAIAAAWRERTSFLGRRLRIADGARTVEGVARDVDDEGALLLDTDDGVRHRILSGESVFA